MKIRQLHLVTLLVVLALAVTQGAPVAACDGHGSHGAAASQASAAAENRVYTATGVIQSVDAAAKKVTIAHGPVPAINWPAMIMDFAVEHAPMLEGLKAGDKARFDFYNQENVSVIMDIEALP
jgi:Cu(I)/Ag(I) efflux system protein CusF